MRANEFIKKYGLDRAKKLLSITSKMNMSNLVFVSLQDGDNLDFEVDELKRLIKSHDLVLEHGSICRAKKYAESKYTAPEVKKLLSKAIADVESCQ